MGFVALWASIPGAAPRCGALEEIRRGQLCPGIAVGEQLVSTFQLKAQFLAPEHLQEPSVGSEALPQNHSNHSDTVSSFLAVRLMNGII